MAESNPSSSRRPCHGSCHCGSTKYVAFLNFPPTISSTPTLQQHPHLQMQLLHLPQVRIFSRSAEVLPRRLHAAVAPEPRDRWAGDYRSSGGKISRYFCKTCGVRCFSFRGVGEVVEVAVEGWGNEEGKRVRVWMPKKEGWKEVVGGSYLSVNAMTLKPGPDGLDLKEWTERNWIWYLDMKNNKVDDRIGEPHEGGCY